MRFSGLSSTEAAMVLGVMRSIFPWEGFDEPVSGADVVDDVNEAMTDLRKRVKQHKHKLEPPVSKPKVLIKVEGGIAEWEVIGEVDVEKVDFDVTEGGDLVEELSEEFALAFPSCAADIAAANANVRRFTGDEEPHPDSPSLEDTMFNHADPINR